MMRGRWAIAILMALASAAPAPAPARAAEGLYTFDAAPVTQIRADLGVDIDPAWLHRLMAASVRFSSGCSGALVSDRGLALTNQHCMLGCEAALSAGAGDAIGAGFGLAAGAPERRCPGLEAQVLESITDVSAAVRSASAGKSGAAFVAAREAALGAAERRACGGAAHRRCQALTFFGGEVFQVYRYRVWDDVRLVFAPPGAVAFFGGQKDNFAFPRWALDCAFVRLYRAGAVATTPDYLAWSSAPPRPGEAVFTAGNPGEGERGLTAAQLASLRDVVLPLAQADEADLRRRLIGYGRQSPAQQRDAAAALFETENDLKRLRGERASLAGEALTKTRKAAEASDQARLAADPALAALVGDPWARLAAIQPRARAEYPVWRELEGGAGGGSALFAWARLLVRAAAERAKPSALRLPEFADPQLPEIERRVMAATPVSPLLERLRLTSWLGPVRPQRSPSCKAAARPPRRPCLPART